MPNTNESRLLSSLKNGQNFTARQIASRFNTSMDAAYSTVRRLRDKGHDVSMREIVSKTGHVLNVYTLPAKTKTRSRKAA